MDEDENSTRINSIRTEPLHHHSPMESQYPLISTIVTLYTIIFLYFPAFSASPLIVSTSVLLLSLLRLGAAQRISQKNQKSLELPPDFDHCTTKSLVDPDPDPLQFHDVDCNVDSSNCEKDSVLDPDSEPVLFHADESNVDSSNCEKDSVMEPEAEPRPFYGDCFVEWNVRAPLEVIYEAYEGEEEEEEGEYTEEKRDEELRVIERYASLSMFYPETDTDTDSSSDGDSPVIGNWDSPEKVCFQWDDELIEIELDCKRYSEVDEENLIEIDLSPANFPVR